jgi:hypothetical protein
MIGDGWTTSAHTDGRRHGAGVARRRRMTRAAVALAFAAAAGAAAAAVVSNGTGSPQAHRWHRTTASAPGSSAASAPPPTTTVPAARGNLTIAAVGDAMVGSTPTTTRTTCTRRGSPRRAFPARSRSSEPADCGWADIVVCAIHAGAEGTAALHVTGADETYVGQDRGNPEAGEPGRVPQFQPHRRARRIGHPPGDARRRRRVPPRPAGVRVPGRHGSAGAGSVRRRREARGRAVPGRPRVAGGACRRRRHRATRTAIGRLRGGVAAGRIWHQSLLRGFRQGICLAIT